MAGSEQRVVAVIMVGGPTKGTRFRPLSLNVPKPLFPLAGQPMVHHPISACRRIPNLMQIYLVGFYEEREFALYVSSISNELRIPVRFVPCPGDCFRVGGLVWFQSRCVRVSGFQGGTIDIVLSISEAHKKYGGMGTLLVNEVSAESANQFGELVADPETNELLHYTEKPETFVSTLIFVVWFTLVYLHWRLYNNNNNNKAFYPKQVGVSDLINCGVYIFTPNIFSAIEDVLRQKKDRGFICSNLRRVSSFEALQSATKALPADYVRLDQDILSPLAGKKELYTYQTLDFWEQIKTPGMSLRCSGLYLSQYRHTSPHLLASGDGKRSATVVGDVYIHPSAKVHPTSKIGPNVSISANARIGAGVRLINCIILDDVEIMENAVVIHSIVGWKSSIGKWSRVQASFSLYHFIILSSYFESDETLLFPIQGEGDHNAKLGITILGEAVDVEDEVVVVNSIVLPNKTLNVSVQEEIIL
ncbi:hypothetical protein PR202_gb18981 [Eleusine coracana subsp. coracana]|uniref:Uncharacterized protein n=1 Tax=Eleusine coracana subsp. coracana TaxID=191504 RepID=A0AAV5F727_ELECO|nr:hypothetical protein PR202_gb18981 [Eleusine coracana subsp. coracana]